MLANNQDFVYLEVAKVEIPHPVGGCYRKAYPPPAIKN
jgi:hypothetical protein